FILLSLILTFSYFYYCILFIIVFFFFFSSRRRHTRSKRDWSSDVCSSDLIIGYYKSKYNVGGIILKKKLVSISLIILTILTSITVYGDGDIEINSDSALLMDYNSGEIIYEKNMDQKVNPASITKVMTLLLTMEALDSNKIKLSDKVNISEYASSMGGTQLYLDVGETQSVESLIKAISIRSANDAAVALGEFIA